jgi:hypothetical protein
MPANVAIADKNYSFAEGFPEPGRQFFANLYARFTPLWEN